MRDSRKRRKAFEWTGAGTIALVLGGCSVMASALQFHSQKRAINKAKRVTAMAAASALEVGIANFESEYGILPVTGKSGGLLRTDRDIGLLEILLGMEQDPNPLNSRGLKFTSLKEGRKRKGGLILTEDRSGVAGLFDPWGNPYFIMLDPESKTMMGISDESERSSGIRQRIVVISPGPDGKPGTKDDV
ncbi:MAG: hypothetical protein H7A50_09050 [Akkermansiaceae bacterium]|nr:hypothetical protein [Akkermansiaceae bacterium]